ncbi:unnamed protein product, partial [Porites lobata]
LRFSLEKLGKPDLELKREQFEAIRAVCVERKDVLAVLPTGFGKSLIYQILPAIFDFLRSRGDKQDENSVVIVVSPLNTLMKDQLKKLEGFLNVCVVQSVEDEEGENKKVLFTQYHAQYPESERSRIVEELVQGTSTHRVLFVTIAFGLGIDCNDIRRVVHIGVPYSMEDYCQEVGRAGRDGLPARADIYYNSYDIFRSRK